MMNKIYNFIKESTIIVTVSLLVLLFRTEVIYGADLGVQLLENDGFEIGTENQPPSNWSNNWTPIEAGAQKNNAAAHSGNSGLWIYTAKTIESSWTKIFQQFSSAPGDVYSGKVWIRVPPDSQWVDWVPGSTALVRVEFHDGSKKILGTYDSTAVTNWDTNWTEYSVVTSPAPPGTTSVQYICYLYKPSYSETRQSVANFDDCYFELTSQDKASPKLDVYPYSIGITRSQTVGQFIIKNKGSGDLTWSLAENESWITDISPSSGTVTAGSQISVIVTVNRDALAGAGYKGTILITSNIGNENIAVYMDMQNGYNVPAGPSIVTTEKHRLLVRRRLPDNSLDAVKPYIIKGVAWSPSGIGDMGDNDSRRNLFHDWYITDIQLLKEMGANTVYLFLDFGVGQESVDILDYLHKNGIMAIVTVDNNGSNDTNRINEVVNAYKDHPSILMWAIGNEWNINYYHDRFGDHGTPGVVKLKASADATEAAAQQIKKLDYSHPVAAIHGEIDIDERQPLLPTPGYLSTKEIVSVLCPSVDIWGLNIYRGDTFGSLFNQWAGISDKPMFLSEFGTDSYFSTGWYNPVEGYESEDIQSNWLNSLWPEIELEISAYNVEKACLGGTVFEWNDEWWKIPSPEGSLDEHDNEGFETYWNLYSHPDGFANEEYFGIVDIGRKPKSVYTTLKSHFSNITNFAPVALPLNINKEQGDSIVVIFDGIDVEGSPLTYEIVDNPAYGSLGDISGNAVTYTASHGFYGTDSFSYRCFDGDKYSASANVGITWMDILPVAHDQTLYTNEDVALDITLSATAGEGGSVTYLIVNQVTHGQISGDAPNLICTPDADYYGPDSFQFKVNDGFSDSNIATIQINVLNQVLEGDIDDSGNVDLKDAVLAIQVCADVELNSGIFKEADVNSDGKIGVEEVIFILKELAEI